MTTELIPTAGDGASTEVATVPESGVGVSALIVQPRPEAQPTDPMRAWADEKVRVLLDNLKSIMSGGVLETRLLPKLTVPGGVSEKSVPAWAIPSALDDMLGGGQGAAREVAGVILLSRKHRSYYAKEIGERTEGEDPRPDCASDDLMFGVGDISGNRGRKQKMACDQCPMNEWGSDVKGGRGKACKEKVTLFVLVPGLMLPLVVIAPPGSLENLNAYLVTHTLRGKHPRHLMTGFGLEVVPGGKVAFARIVFKTKSELGPQDKAYVDALADALLPILSKAKLEDDGGGGYGEAAGGGQTQAATVKTDAPPVDPAAEAEAFAKDFGISDPDETPAEAPADDAPKGKKSPVKK